MPLRRVIDAVLEAPVVPSFTRIGYDLRSRVDGWTDLDDYDLSGRRILLTGGTSGLGRAAALQLTRCGADVTITGRSLDRAEHAAAELGTEAGNGSVTALAADMGDLRQVSALADRLIGDGAPVDVLVHNAGALSAERRVTDAGHEATVASQVYGPFLLTHRLLDSLAAAGGRVITMSSGGMYSTGLSLGGLEMSAPTYSGARQYALAKRAQVTLNELWAQRHGDRGISFQAMHPGWADTPGVAEALPTFGAIVGPLLRNPEQGADTLVWLAADDAAGRPGANGGFWHDRRRRSLHKTPLTSRTDTPARRAKLWDLVAERSGADPN